MCADRRLVWIWMFIAWITAGQASTGQTNTGQTNTGQEFWKLVPTGTDASLRGLSAIDQKTAWTCGSQGTLLGTIDGGQTWTRRGIEGLESTELRSIHAWSADELVVATAGTPCRIYLSKDAGRTWKIVYENEHPQAFIDGMKFWDEKRGFVFGDPIDGKLMALRSDDRGQHWLSSAQQDYRLGPGEAGFAASNSSLMVFEPESVWIGLGGASGAAQVLISDDGGLNWTRSDVEPIPSGKSSGIFSLARGAQGQVVAVGGDYMQADGKTGNVALYDSVGRVWQRPRGKGPGGFRSSVIYLSQPIRIERSDQGLVHWICAGPNGSEASADAQDWFALSDESFHALAVASDGSLWACGAKGRVGLHVR